MSMTSVLTLPAPGWYPDPVGAATYRWWDGSRWTEGTHEGDTEEQQVAASEPAFEPEPAFDPVVFESAVFEPATSVRSATTVLPSNPLPPREPVAPPAPSMQDPIAQTAPLAPQGQPATASTPVARRGVSPAKTRWSTILAAYPFVYPFAVGLVVALAYAGGSSSNMSTLAIIAGATAVVLLLPTFILAERDRKELLERGYQPAPSLAWMLLLPPIGYLIARRRVVGPAY